MKTKANKEADMMIGKICGTGSSIPVKIMDNDDLSNMVDTNDAWIRERTGVEKRHIAESESTVSMAVEAGRQALAQTGIRPEELDMIVVSTMSPDAVLPCTACEVQKAIGAEGAVCFDLQAACTGFIFAYNTAQAYIQSNMCRTVLLIGSERLSRLVDWTDRGTCILFGDGAGAAVLKAAEGRAYLCFIRYIPISGNNISDASHSLSKVAIQDIQIIFRRRYFLYIHILSAGVSSYLVYFRHYFSFI